MSAQNQQEKISSELFEHHFITKDPEHLKSIQWGYGVPTLSDLDQDGDLDFTIGVRSDSLYWFEFKDWDNWKQLTVGPLNVHTLGGAAHDVDQDGWTDIIAGGYWYRNPQNPKNKTFSTFRYDSTINSELHDISLADINGNGDQNLVVLGDEEGLFWYQIPDKPSKDMEWKKHLITKKFLDQEVNTHSGFSPNGIGDLDQDNDPDIVLPNRWLENKNRGKEWRSHDLPSGKKGPWGLSSRSWLIDLNNDGLTDIVMADSDQTESAAYWLENTGGTIPEFKLHQLPSNTSGKRGSFHSLAVADFDLDGDQDIFTAEQEDNQIFPQKATPKWFIWENTSGQAPSFKQRVILDDKLGGHDATVGDVDQDGDPDICSKIWKIWEENSVGGSFHAECLENKIKE